MPGQHDVEEHEVEALVPRRLERGLAIGRGRDLVALAGQVEGEGLPQGGIVFDEEQASSHRLSRP